MLFRYSRWDGTQRVDFDAEDLLDAMADDVLYDGDPWRAMRRLMQQGMQTPEGGKMPGLRDLLERLKRQRQQRLDRYDLGSSLDDIEEARSDRQAGARGHQAADARGPRPRAARAEARRAAARSRRQDPESPEVRLRRSRGQATVRGADEFPAPADAPTLHAGDEAGARQHESPGHEAPARDAPGPEPHVGAAGQR